MNINSNSYEEIKNHYNGVINLDSSIMKNSNDISTPIECVEEMLSKIDEDFWKNENLRILDPCCGCGNFFVVIYNLLIKHHSKDKILKEMLFFNDIDTKRLDVSREIFKTEGVELNVTNLDYLSEDFSTEKFDLIIANPPYATILADGKRSAKNHNPINDFITKTLELLREKGLLAFITPDNWMSYSRKNLPLVKSITSKQIHHLNIHTAKKYFKKVGSSFTWYIIENRDSYKNITVESIWKNEVYKSIIPSKPRHYIPLLYTELTNSILEKTVDNDNQSKFAFQTSSFLHKFTKKKLISPVQDSTFVHRLVHTPSQTVFSSIPHTYQKGFKIFIGLTSYYSVFVDNCGITQSMGFILSASEEQANKFCKILQHPLYEFINNICRWGNFNNIRILQSLPYCEEEDVYKYFNITDDEIKFIEKILNK